MLKYHTVLFFILLTLFSCEKELDVNLSDQERITVVNALFNPDEPFSTTVTGSLNPLKTENIEEIISAKVMLFENDVFKEDLVYSKSDSDKVGQFIGTTIPEATKNYKLEVVVDGKITSSINDRIPDKIIISDLNVNWVAWGDSNFVIRYFFDFEITDPPGESFYYFDLSFPIYVLNEVTGEYKYHSQQYLEIIPTDLPGHERYLNNAVLFTDEAFKNGTKRITGTGTTFTEAGPFLKAFEDKDAIIDKNHLHMTFHSTSAEAYKYHSSLAKEIEAANDVYSEPTIIYSNIINGLGIFGSENITKLISKVVY